nr:MAG TPA: hypothetical protein [Caudoviricetes sp.]
MCNRFTLFWSGEKVGLILHRNRADSPSDYLKKEI